MDAGGNRCRSAEARQEAALNHGGCRGTQADRLGGCDGGALRGQALAGQRCSLPGHETRRFEDSLSDRLLRGSLLGDCLFRRSFLGDRLLRESFLDDFLLRGSFLGDHLLRGSFLGGRSLRGSFLGQCSLNGRFLRRNFLRGLSDRLPYSVLNCFLADFLAHGLPDSSFNLLDSLFTPALFVSHAEVPR